MQAETNPHKKGKERNKIIFKMIDLMLLDRADLGYIAGFVDGEGYIGIVSYGKNYRKKRGKHANHTCPAIDISNTNFKVMEYFANRIFNRKLYIRPDKRPNHKIKYVMQLRAKKDICDFLVAIRHHLIVKREQAELLIEFCNIKPTDKSKTKNCKKYSDTENTRRDEIYEKLKELNKRGTEEKEGTLIVRKRQ